MSKNAMKHKKMGFGNDGNVLLTHSPNYNS